MNTVQDFLNKLTDVNWNSTTRRDDAITGTLPSGEEISFSIDTKIANNHHDIDNMPVQIIGRVTIDGEYAGSWGACDSADCAAMVRFYRVNENKASEAEYSIERQRKDAATSLFDSL